MKRCIAKGCNRRTRGAFCWQHAEMWKYSFTERKLFTIQALINKQANDEGLWFKAEYASEDYLQKALRDLHEAIGEIIDI